MNYRAQLLCLLVLLGVPAALGESSTGKETRRAASWDDYRVLSERNIFDRNRRQPRERQPTPRQPVGVTNTDKYLVLTGTVRHGPDGVAFVENTRSGETSRVRTGDAVGNGKLVKITLDCVEYECNGSTVRIEIGSSLLGMTPSRVPTNTAASTQPAASADVLERMRRRRELETK